jgi:3',5'-cyclic AMP phosphodiesterase CpdA
VRVFAVEPNSVQLDWAALGPGTVRIAAADSVVEVDTDGGPGTATLDGLPAGRHLTVRVEGDGVPEGRGGRRGRIERSVTTPFPPPGSELARVATISDLHVGETTFGYLHTIGESVGTPVDESHSIRAARAGIAEALAWGAQRLVLKGDIVDQSHPGHWREVEKLLADVPVPMHVIAGNHEVKRRRTIEPADALADSVAAYTDTVDAIDLGGASLVLVNSTEPDHERGRLSHLQGDLLGALGSAPGGALVALHHHLRHGRNPGAWPVGVPAVESTQALDAIVRVHPATMLTSGHVHRHRIHRHGPLTLTCVGSVKDYPGVWAGYVFYEGGIRQVVRRVSEPSTLRWTERTGDALAGAYRYWTPSLLSTRCVTVTWP